MSQPLKLVYWDFPFWRAEVCRLTLHLGDVPFEDLRVTRAQSQAMKGAGQLPFGQLPVLMVGDEVIPQTGAIARYCGKLAGLYPENDPLAAARVDAVLDAATDITWQVRPSIRERDPAKKASMRAQLAAEVLPIWLQRLESWLDRYGEHGYMVGPELTIADLAIWRLIGWLRGGVLDGIPTSVADHLPRLMAHQQKIGEHPKIHAWMSERYGDR